MIDLDPEAVVKTLGRHHRRMGEQSMEKPLQGAIIVVKSRMIALEQAIEQRDWEAIEFQFDRVLRATTKLEQLEQLERADA